MSIKSKIQSLITAANATTGESDATLTDAVQTLVDGYGQGGGSGSGLSVLASGTYTLAGGTKTLQIPVTAPITGTPKEAYIYRDDTITGTESLAAFVLLDAPTEVTYDGKYFKGNAGFVDRYSSSTISNPPTKVILSSNGSNGFSDGVLSATTTGANFKAGRYVWAIYGETSGGGGGGSGYAKKTGSFVLATDYTYSESVANGYRGSLMVDTGLTKIDYVTMWVEEWMNQTLGEATSAGLYTATNMLARLGDNAGAPNYYIPALGVLKNNATNYFYGDGYGGIVTHLVCPNDVPEGSFGFRCRAGAYAIRAGCTVRWEAAGTE